MSSYFLKFYQSKYLILLIALIGMLLSFPLMEDILNAKLLFSLFFLLILVGMFYGLKGTHRLLVFMGIGLCALSINFAQLEFKNLDIFSRILSILFYLYAIILFCKDIYTSKQITRDILIGSISVYLLIGICFALMYMILQSINANTFIHQASGLPINTQSDFYYFSFITFATVGFGDIIALTPFAKSLVMLEGVVGIFYIAIFVARLITIFNK